MSRRPAGDQVLLTRATRALAIRAAALVAVAMLLLVGLVTLVVVHGQRSARDQLLRTTAASADDVGDPPPGVWLVLTHDEKVISSPGLPAPLAGQLRSLRSHAQTRLAITDLGSGNGAVERVATQRRADRIVQVVLDLRSERSDRRRLLDAMLAASLLGLLLAAGFGALLGRRAVRPLADALELQRTFVADASHELRTPLTLLSTRAQLLDRAVQEGALDEQARMDSAGVVADVQRLGEVLDDLLVAADPTGQTPVEIVRLDALVAAAVESARAHAADAGVALAVVSEPADERGGSTQVLGSPPALRRAVLALVDNAIDHTPVGGSVAVQVRPGRRQVVLQVADTGPGISPAAAKDAVRRFHSGGQRAGRAHYGLGLALSNDIVNRHGGQLRLVDGAQGATFEVSLPVAAELGSPRASALRRR
ncbi:MAG: HAMP domain-containing sensor histidine kinase [Mycobacteriales bacterium]